MSSATLIRFGGLTLCLGGVAAALFALLAAPEGGFMGAHLPHQSTWMPAHSLHALSGLLLLFGVVALYATRAAAATWLARSTSRRSKPLPRLPSAVCVERICGMLAPAAR